MALVLGRVREYFLGREVKFTPTFPQTSLDIPMPAGTKPPKPSSYEAIFSAWHRAGMVAVAPTAVGLLSVTVEDQSSAQNPPTRVWSFLERHQVESLHRVLGDWLASSART